MPPRKRSRIWCVLAGLILIILLSLALYAYRKWVKRPMNVQHKRRRRWQSWPRWVLGFLLVVFLIVIPLGAAWYDWWRPFDRPMLEFLMGTFPNQEYSLSDMDFKSSSWLTIGIIFRSFIVIGMPVGLTVAIAVLLRRIERGLHMRLTEYINARDTYLQTELYAEFRNLLRQANIEDADKKCTDLIEHAFDRGKAEWERVQAQRIKRAIQDMELPEAHARSRGY